MPLPLRLGACTVVVLAALAGCGDSPTVDGEETTGGCIGKRSGAYELSATSPSELPGVDSAGLSAANLDEDPPVVSLILTGASKAETNNGVDLQVGDEFTVDGKSYTLRGACRDKAWLDSVG